REAADRLVLGRVELSERAVLERHAEARRAEAAGVGEDVVRAQHLAAGVVARDEDEAGAPARGPRPAGEAGADAGGPLRPPGVEGIEGQGFAHRDSASTRASAASASGP